MAPLQGHTVFPAGWSKYHRPVAVGTMTAVCDIWEPGPPGVGFDDSVPRLVAEGVPCRVQQRTGGAVGGPVESGQHVTERDYLITLPVRPDTSGLRTGPGGHVLTVTSHTDPDVDGRRFHITQVLTGSEVWERDLICTDATTQNQTGGEQV